MVIGGSPRMWLMVSYGYGALVVAGLAYVLLDMPIQVADGYTNMTALAGRSLVDGIYNEFFQPAYLRPLLWGQHHLVYTLAGGRYFEWFRGWHAVQVLLLVILFIRVLRPSDAAGAALVPLGLAVLVGIHTFAGTVREAFPINTFMTVLLCAVGAANLAFESAPSRWRNVAAALLFVFAALTVESGLLVWVVFAAAYIAGARGISRATMVALTVLLAGYFGLRFGILHVGSPGLIERSSGYGFTTRNPEALIALFGAHPWRFYAYNVVSSVLSVLWSEPRGGIWRLTRAVVEREQVPPYMLVGVAASALATAVLLRFVWVRRAAWRARDFEPADRIVVVFLAVLAANAVLSYPYTKDVIMSPAGMFYALAVAAATRHLIVTARPRLTGALIVFLVALSGGWAVRAAAIHVAIRASGNAVRDQWAYLDQWQEREGKAAAVDGSLQLQNQLRDDAIVRHPGKPVPAGEWLQWLDAE